MAEHLNSLWLFPLAFLLLVSSKLYVVTRGALVPEMARTDQFREHAAHVGDAGWPNNERRGEEGLRGVQRATHVARHIRRGLSRVRWARGSSKASARPSVLIVASLVYIAATVASVRLQRPAKIVREEVDRSHPSRARSQRAQSPRRLEVAWGLGAAALMRFAAGFATFLLAFGLRRTWRGSVGTLSRSASAVSVRSADSPS